MLFQNLAVESGAYMCHIVICVRLFQQPSLYGPCRCIGCALLYAPGCMPQLSSAGCCRHGQRWRSLRGRSRRPASYVATACRTGTRLCCLPILAPPSRPSRPTRRSRRSSIRCAQGFFWASVKSGLRCEDICGPCICLGCYNYSA